MKGISVKLATFREDSERERESLDKASIFASVKAGCARVAAALCVKRVVAQCMLTHIRVVAISDPSFP